MAEISPPGFYGLSIHVTVTIAPTDVDKFLTILRPAYEAVAAEPECTFFEVCVSSSEPGVVRWVEGWSKDRQWLFDVQLQKDYYRPFLESTESMWVKPRQLQIFERLPAGWARSKPEHFTMRFPSVL